MRTRTLKNHAAGVRPSYVANGSRRAALADCGMNSDDHEALKKASRFLLESYSSFGIQEFRNLVASANLEPSIVKSYFDKFTRQAVADGQIKEVKSCCYDWNTFENLFKGECK